MFAITPEASLKAKHNRGIIEYSRIECPHGKTGKVIEMRTAIQDKFQVGNEKGCLDYVRLEFPESKNNLEFCGENNSISVTNIEFKELNVVFQNSEKQNDKNSFYICVSCVNALLSNQMGCLSTSEMVTVEEYLSERTHMYRYNSYGQDYAFGLESEVYRH